VSAAFTEALLAGLECTSVSGTYGEFNPWDQTGISPSPLRLQALVKATVECHQGMRGQRLRLLGESWASESSGIQKYLLHFLHPPAPFQDLLREEGDEETTNDVPHIQCEDGCDPQGLRDNSQVLLRMTLGHKGERTGSYGELEVVSENDKDLRGS
jgi:hypothetical protein